MTSTSLVANHELVRGEPRSGLVVKRVDQNHYEVEFHDGRLMTVPFHHGEGVDPLGVSMEALLHVVMDRLERFQDGEHPAPENQRAIEFIEQALLALRNREARVAAEADEAKAKAPGTD